MSTFERSYGGTLATLANYKAMGDAVMDAIVGFGWVQTADTNQVTDWSTIVAAPTTQATANFMLFTNSNSTDALQVIVKLYFWQTTSTYLDTYIEMGLETDGAGNITRGRSAPGVSAYGILSTGAGTNRVIGSGDNDRFTIVVQESNSTAYCLISVDASRDNSGAVTDEYFYYYGLLQTSTVTGVFGGVLADGSLLPLYETQATSGNSVYILPSVFDWYQQSSMIFNGNTCVSPVFPFVGKVGNPTIGLMVACNNDVPFDTTVSVSIYGTTRTYRGVNPQGALVGDSSNDRTLILWE